MKSTLQLQLLRAKHHTIVWMRQGQGFLQRNGWRLALLAFVLSMFLMKDVSFSLNMNSPGGGTAWFGGGDDDEPPAPNPLAAKAENGHSEPSVPNAANTFSNLGFILNPSYAKRNKVAKRIVDFHNGKCESYVKQYAPLAQKEMGKYGIPASIKLAQGLLESNAGDSRLAKENNNHFGIKCFSKKCKKGHCSNFMDDSHKDFFRRYDTAKESYRAHSEFLQKDRYLPLRKLGSADYEGWAYGLKEAGYATDKRYAEKLIRIIEALELYEYDG